MTHRLILAILRGDQCDRLVHQLLDAGFRVTEFSSVGGFFRRKHITLLIGLSEDRLEDAFQILRTACPTSPDDDEHNITFFVLKAAQTVII